MKDYLSNNKAIFKALRNTDKALLVTHFDDGREDGMSHEHIFFDNFPPRVIVCIGLSTYERHNLHQDSIAPVLLNLHPSVWEKVGIHAVLVGEIVSETDVMCGPSERGIVLLIKRIDLYQDRKKFRSIEEFETA